MRKKLSVIIDSAGRAISSSLEDFEIWKEASRHLHACGG